MEYKVIDLINDKAPKKIKFKGGLYEFDNVQKDYVDTDQEYLFCNQFMIGKILNDEVEIIEEDKEIEFEDIEEINIHLGMLNMTPTEKHISNFVNQLIRNQKKIIKAVNELKKGK